MSELNIGEQYSILNESIHSHLIALKGIGAKDGSIYGEQDLFQRSAAAKEFLLAARLRLQSLNAVCDCQKSFLHDDAFSFPFLVLTPLLGFLDEGMIRPRHPKAVC